MRFQHLVNEVSRKQNLTYSQTERVLLSLGESVCLCLGRGETADFGDLGTWFIKEGPCRTGPECTGNRYVQFQPGKALRCHLQRR
jgi:nucleoid DNA-binding protein